MRLIGSDECPKEELDQSKVFATKCISMKLIGRLGTFLAHMHISTSITKKMAWIALCVIWFFVAVLSIFKILDVFIPDVYPSRGFAESMKPYGLVMIIILPTVVTICEYYLLDESRKSKRIKDSERSIRGKIYSAMLLSVSFYLVMTIVNQSITRAAATFLHIGADKARVEFSATVRESQAHNRYSSITGCYRKVEISSANFESDWDTICVNKELFQLILNGGLPVRVKFLGLKSYYGYEVWPVVVVGGVTPQ